MAIARFTVLITLLLSTIIATAPLRLAFNGEGEVHSSDIDGPWPTIPLLYNDSSGGQAQLDCYLTLWPESIFIARQACVATLPLDETGILCSDELELPNFYESDLQNSDSFNISEWREEFVWNQGNSTLYGDGLNHENEDSIYAIAELVRNLHADGLGNQLLTGVDLGTITSKGIPVIVGNNFSQTLYNVSGSLPILGSTLSLYAGGANASLSANLSYNLLVDLYDRGKIPSKSFGMHMGSVQPWQSGSLYLGGYDRSRIMDNVTVKNLQTFDPPALNSIYLGVEKGYFPLKSKLTLNVENGSFFQGPWSINALSQQTFSGASQTLIAFEPGLPYLYLPRGYCDSIAAILPLNYDESRNLYLWTIPADAPLFRSPSYIEFGFGPWPPSSEGVQEYTSVKIPLALLQHTFHATCRARNGSLVPPARYFPCSPVDQSPDIYAKSEWSRDPTFGRAFMQSAFFAMDWHSGKQFLAQAPGPTNLHNEDVVSFLHGDTIKSTRTTIELNSWTDTWSGVLPAWTIDTDGAILNLNGSGGDNGLSSGEKTGIAVGTILGTFLMGALALISVKLCLKSYQRRKQNCLDMQEEDALAYSIEAAELEKERLLPTVNEGPMLMDEDSDARDSIHQIPRKSVPSRRVSQHT